MKHIWLILLTFLLCLGSFSIYAEETETGVAVLTLSSFSGGGPEYTITIGDPQIVSYTCRTEYDDPDSRRFDAQPNCCPDCGPEVYVIGTDWKNSAAISAARNAIMSGKIVAIKGIGGFHLCCDAKNAAAVQRLRQLKQRPMKPFAVMLRDMDTVRRECIVQAGQETYLTGWQKPVLLLKKRADTTLCAEIAPDNETLGVMLPYAPVQMLLFDCPDGIKMTDSLVMTSGNARGAPICRNDADAEKEIAGFSKFYAHRSLLGVYGENSNRKAFL